MVIRVHAHIWILFGCSEYELRNERRKRQELWFGFSCQIQGVKVELASDRVCCLSDVLTKFFPTVLAVRTLEISDNSLTDIFWFFQITSWFMFSFNLYSSLGSLLFADVTNFCCYADDMQLYVSPSSSNAGSYVKGWMYQNVLQLSGSKSDPLLFVHPNINML